jgi:carbon monoxide dehydrogenase subunit G
MTDHTIKMSSNIQASTDKVFGVITDFERYKAWNPLVTDAGFETIEGQEIYTCHKYFGKARLKLLKTSQQERLLMETCGWQNNLIKTQYDVVLLPGADGDTLYTLKVTVSGPVAQLAGRLLKYNLRKIFKNEVRALKQYCENSSHLTPPKKTTLPSMDLKSKARKQSGSRNIDEEIFINTQKEYSPEIFLNTTRH